MDAQQALAVMGAEMNAAIATPLAHSGTAHRLCDVRQSIKVWVTISPTTSRTNSATRPPGWGRRTAPESDAGDRAEHRGGAWEPRAMRSKSFFAEYRRAIGEPIRSRVSRRP